MSATRRTRLSALQKAVLYYFVDPERTHPGDPGGRYRERTDTVLRWVAKLRGELFKGLNPRRGGGAGHQLRQSFYRSLKNMEAKGLLVRERRAWSGYTRLIELTPEGIRLARRVDRADFVIAFDKLREENDRKTRELLAAMAEVSWEIRYEQ